MKGKAVFLDRDGVLYEDVHFIKDPGAERHLLPTAVEAVQTLNREGWKVVVASNQSGVARGYLTEDDVHEQNRSIAEELATKGAHVDAFYFCPHHPEYGKTLYRIDCDCRKPKPGMLIRAAVDLNLDLEQSYMIGDLFSDVETGKRAGCKAILVLTGHGREQLSMAEGLEADSEKIDEDPYGDERYAIAKKRVNVQPDFIAEDLWHAVDIIVNGGQRDM